MLVTDILRKELNAIYSSQRLDSEALDVSILDSFRSDMNWESIDVATLDHFRCLGTIRHNYPFVVAGRQETIDTHTCARIDGDKVAIIRVRPEECSAIPMGGYFAEGEEVVDLCTVNRGVIDAGRVRFERYKNDVAVIVAAQE